MRRRLVFYGVTLVALVGLWQAGPWAFWSVQRTRGGSQPDIAAGSRRLADIARLPLAVPRITVDKSERLLTLHDGDSVIKTYKIGLGGAPNGHKLREGDQRTPAGRYYLCTRTEATPFHLFIGLNYPNAADARAGLADGRIDRSTAAKIIESETRRGQPDWNTALGGAVGIHGMGSFGDWTLGCIAVDNADIEEIWSATWYWTPVDITE